MSLEPLKRFPPAMLPSTTSSASSSPPSSSSSTIDTSSPDPLAGPRLTTRVVKSAAAQTTRKSSTKAPPAITTILTDHGTITPASSSISSSPVLVDMPHETTTDLLPPSPPHQQQQIGKSHQATMLGKSNGVDVAAAAADSIPSSKAALSKDAAFATATQGWSTGAQLFKYTASEIAPRISSGEVSVEDWARSLLGRIDKRDSLVGAWAYLDRERVIQEARRLDSLPASQRGPLHGVPVAVKDVMYTKDMPTMHNSPLYVNSFPEVDAACVRLLRQAGALIFGKTTTTEFAAMFHGPPTRNPHSLPPWPIRTPGGSSSGSGAAVGDFQAPLALATQTGGSTIRPASFNGIYGLKPTWGAISREGTKFYSVTLDTVGLYARSVDDLDLMADVMGLSDDEEEVRSSGALESETAAEIGGQISFADGEGVRGKRFAVYKTTSWSHAGEGTRDAMATAASLLRAHGAIAEEITLPEEFDNLPEWHTTLLQTEGKANFLPEYRVAKAIEAENAMVPHSGSQKLGTSDSVRQASMPDGRRPLLNEHIVEHVENVHRYTHRDHLKAFDGVARLRPVLDDILGGYAALLAPSAPDEAPLGNDTTGSAVFCSGWTILHTPVMNIPGFQGANGLPVGVSLVAPRFRDRHLIRVSKAVGQIFEAEGGWKRKNL